MRVELKYTPEMIEEMEKICTVYRAPYRIDMRIDMRRQRLGADGIRREMLSVDPRSGVPWLVSQEYVLVSSTDREKIYEAVRRANEGVEPRKRITVSSIDTRLAVDAVNCDPERVKSCFDEIGKILPTS